MPDTKLEKLKKLLEITNEGLTRSEFLDSFKKVVDQILKLEAKLISKIDGNISEEKEKLETLKQEFEQVIESAKEESDNSLSGFKRKTVELINSLFAKSRVNQKLSEVLDSVDDKLQDIDDKMAGIKDGYIPVKGVDYFDGQPGKDGSPDTARQVLDKVISLDGEDGLQIADIYKLREELDELRNMKTQKFGGGGGFSTMSMNVHIIDDETPTNSGDNLNFTLALTPSPASSLKLYRNGQRLRITEDFTLSGNTITLLTAFSAGEILLADYRV